MIDPILRNSPTAIDLEIGRIAPWLDDQTGNDQSDGGRKQPDKCNILIENYRVSELLSQFIHRVAIYLHSPISYVFTEKSVADSCKR